jgi:hypothetical protein
MTRLNDANVVNHTVPKSALAAYPEEEVSGGQQRVHGKLFHETAPAVCTLDANHGSGQGQRSAQ